MCPDCQARSPPPPESQAHSPSSSPPSVLRAQGGDREGQEDRTPALEGQGGSRGEEEDRLMRSVLFYFLSQASCSFRPQNLKALGKRRCRGGAGGPSELQGLDASILRGRGCRRLCSLPALGGKEPAPAGRANLSGYMCSGLGRRTSGKGGSQPRHPAGQERGDQLLTPHPWRHPQQVGLSQRLCGSVWRRAPLGGRP